MLLLWQRFLWAVPDDAPTESVSARATAWTQRHHSTATALMFRSVLAQYLAYARPPEATTARLVNGPTVWRRDPATVPRFGNRRPHPNAIPPEVFHLSPSGATAPHINADMSGIDELIARRRARRKAQDGEDVGDPRQQHHSHGQQQYSA